MEFREGDIVKVYDEAEDDWFEGTILELYDDEAMVEYETTHWYHVTAVKYSDIKSI